MTYASRESDRITSNPVLEGQIQAPFSILQVGLGCHFPCWKQFPAWGHKNPPWRTRFSHPSLSYLSLQSPFHSPWPQGFHKRTRFTCLPWLLSWQFREEINSNKHLLSKQRVCFFVKRQPSRCGDLPLSHLWQCRRGLGPIHLTAPCCPNSPTTTAWYYLYLINNNVELNWIFL